MIDPDLVNAAHARAHEFFLAQHLHWWQVETNMGTLDPTALQVAELGALVRLAATLAVDAGMPADIFAATARESYADAHRSAPKWG